MKRVDPKEWGGCSPSPGVHYINFVRMLVKLAKPLKKWDENCNGPSLSVRLSAN
jgi:hypothetical protein